MREDEAARREIHPGVREIEHTADLGMDVEAGSLDELFRRAAAGMMALVREDPETEGPGRPSRGRARPTRDAAPRTVELEGDGDAAGLLVRWLRELLYLQEVDHFVYGEVEFERLDESGLRASVRRDPDPAPQIRELKGVTYHGLRVERADGGWHARVIFDI